MISVGRWVRRSPAGFLLHLALLLILAGAIVTSLCARRGEACVKRDVDTSVFISADGREERLPFTLRLDSTEVVCHEGTTAPADYKASMSVVSNGGETVKRTVSMNRVLEVRGYRFCLKQMDDDSAGLSVNRDPWGIGITYAGYYLLFACSAWILTGRLFKGIRRGRCAAMMFGLLCAANASASPSGDAFGSMRVYWGDRPAAMETMCRDLLTRVYGHDSYKGMPATDVMLGWLFEYDAWTREPIIKVKGDKVRNLLGITGKYAAYEDFFSQEGYKLDGLSGDLTEVNVRQADEKVKLIASWCAGTLMKIYPYRSALGRWEWLSPVDSKPSRMPLDQDRKSVV